jgi:hypothetical protein
MADKPVIDAHMHIQPWEMIRPAVLEKMKAGRTDLDRYRACMESPSEFLKFMDEQASRRRCWSTTSARSWGSPTR